MENKIQFFDIIFLGLAQNCEKFLPKFFNTIDKLSKNKQIKVFIGENGSSDLTFDVIQKKIVFSDVYQFVDTTFIEKFNDRIKRLALARQSLKDNILKLNIKSKYVCVIDLDDVINDIFNEKLLNNLINKLETNRDKYFGVSLSSKPYYYDILNFESEEFPNTNIKKLQNNKSIKSYQNRKKFIYNVQQSLTKDRDFECISGFNGLCIYPYEEYIKSNYIENTIDQTPEHLLFNRYLNKTLDKKILITDNFFKMPDEHKPLNNIFQFVFEKFIKYMNIYYNKFFNN
jgi:hypothetical protein